MAIGDRKPDLTLILDLAPEDGLQRAARRRGRGATADRFEREGLEFHRTLRNAFLAIARREPERCMVIDASLTEVEVAAAIWRTVSERLGRFLPEGEGA